MLSRLTTWAFWADALERAVSQAAEKLLAMSLFAAGATIADLDWYTIIGVALGSGLLSILLSAVSVPGSDAGLPMWVALVWRIARTFGNSLATMLIAVDVLNVFTVDWFTMLSVSATTTLLALIKNAASRPIEAAPTT